MEPGVFAGVYIMLFISMCVCQNALGPGIPRFWSFLLNLSSPGENPNFLRWERLHMPIAIPECHDPDHPSKLLL